MWGVCCLFLAVSVGCVARGKDVDVTQARVAQPFRADKLRAIDQAFAEAIAAGQLPGGVVWVEHRGAQYHKAYGNRAVEPKAEPTTEDTVFDAASLTKVLSTTPAILLLAERGQIDIEAPVSKYFPEFAANGKEAITVRHLLTHTSGLRPGLGRATAWEGWDAALKLAAAETPTQSPGSKFVYSDINFIVLGELVRRVSGRELDAFVATEIFGPLGMVDTGYRRRGKASKDVSRIAPTERTGDATFFHGEVHDPTARRMGGVAGHAGIFTTAADVARFSRMMVSGGVLEGKRLFKAETVRWMTSVQSPAGLPARGLGWDIDSPYAGPRGSRFKFGSYGHTGWTGTSMWIDPETETFVIVMSNRNHPTEAGDARALRKRVGTLAAEALPDVEWPTKEGAMLPHAWGDGDWGMGAADASGDGVLNGIDVLVQTGFEALRGRKVGLITNHTGRDRTRRPTIDLLHTAPGVELVALFSPEHGIRGLLDEKVSDGRDEKTGLPVYSLYGERRAPTLEQLAGVDVLVFDIQDIGCRFYTYISTLGNCMEVAAKAGKEFIVLDRVNPVTGTRVEGPVLTGARSFVAWHEIPLRHGMTAGELARMFNAERGMGVKLTVVPCRGWRRKAWYDATGLPWTNPSPNMRSLTEATLYPGVGVLEFCALSVGRGTGTPFEVIGAPYIDDLRLAAELNAAELPGVRFVPARFTPTASVFQGKECGGVQILVTDRDRLRASDLGMLLTSTLYRLHPTELKPERLGTLLGDAATWDAIQEGKPLKAILKVRDRGMRAFERRRGRYLIYR